MRQELGKMLIINKAGWWMCGGSLFFLLLCIFEILHYKSFKAITEFEVHVSLYTFLIIY